MLTTSHTSSKQPQAAITRGLALLGLILLLAALFASSAQAAAVGLGRSEPFSVLGNSTVTNTGSSVLTGDLGLSPNTSITGFPPGLVNGTIHVNDQPAIDAQADLGIAYNDAARRSSTATISSDLAGLTLTPGVYTQATPMGLSGDLTLDAQGDPNAVFVFQAGDTLTTASSSRVLLTNGAQACNVFWQVGSSATIGTSTAFTGNILAYTSITVTTGASIDGRALALNGAVTLDTNTITRSVCATPPAGAGGTGGTTGATGGTTGTTTGGTGTTTGVTGGTTGGTGTTTGVTGGTGSATGGSSNTTPIVGSTPTPTTPTGTTPSVRTPPVVITTAASRLGFEDARLAGLVRPGSTRSTYYFQFGTTKRYGHHTTHHGAAAGRRALRVRAQVRGLHSNTTYHYRIVSVGPGGRKTYGIDTTFRTRARPARRSPARAPITNGGFTG